MTIEQAIREIVRKEISAAPSKKHETLSHDPLQLLSVRRVAEVLETSIDYVYDIIRAGELPTVELGHGRPKMRVRRRDLESFIAGK
ncbi:hypothetical protein B7R22_09880 [Subtercola boreus]|uniref:Helix-turn-helix domain-containing protein n=1 Tax=Subtercola boreus TaxID=120213 RepID=A0A3E0VYP5_9MICO|nr:helix-turn-helix domain-containing protein [Subtercola boreus]RFA13937.1 hypothetical protein B7R22_09880 [Subtercola boreus]